MIENIKELKDILENLIVISDVVLITPHNGPDFDAIGSAVALNMIARSFDKEVYIILNDDINSIERGTRLIIDELPDNIKFIKVQEIDEIIRDKKSLLITTDTNKKNLVSFDNFKDFDNILIVDHHDIGDETIDTEYKYIDTSSSSTCEILYQLLKLFNIRIDYRTISDDKKKDEVVNIANYLLSGISLDTSKYTKHVTSNTMKIVSKLLDKGADMNYVNGLYLDDFESDMRIQNLVSKTVWSSFNIGVSLNNDAPETIYTKEDLAKAADWIMKYKSTDAAFTLGFIEDAIEEYVVYISARSRGKVNVGEIMSQMGGGGNEYSAATRIVTDDIKQVKLRLDDVIRPGYKLKDY